MSNRPPQPNRALVEDAERQALFLEGLRKTGSPVAAARAASPHLQQSRARHRGYSAFRRLRLVDPEFAEAWDAAMDEFRADLEVEVLRRALEVPKRPVLNKDGKIVAEVEDRNSADRVLLRLMARHDPSWAERRELTGTIEHSGGVNVSHWLNSPHSVTIDADDIDLLDESQRVALLDALQTIEQGRQERDERARALPGKAIDDTVIEVVAEPTTHG